MKIICIAKTAIPSPAANSIQTVRMCEALCSLGHDVKLISLDFHRDEIMKVDWKEYYGVRVAFPCTRIRLPRIPGAERFAIFILSTWAAIARPTMLYTRYLRLADLSARFGVPTVWEAHQPFNETQSKRQFLRFIHYPGFRSVVVISNALAQYFVNHYDVSRANVYVAPDGASRIEGTPTQDLVHSLVENQELRAGYAGHLYEGKGMEIIERVSSLCPRVGFYVAGGNSSDLAYWKEWLEDRSNVHFLGPLLPSDVPGFLTEMDVLLAPYQRIVKGAGGGQDIADWMSPLKIFEYMATGRPIVASDLPVIREVLDSSTAILCDPETTADWVAALEALSARPDDGRRLGERARREFESKYTWEARAERIVEHFQLSDGRRRSEK